MEENKVEKLEEENEKLKRQLVDLNHAIDVYWNDGRSMTAEKYICHQQKKSLQLLSCDDCQKYPCDCHEPFKTNLTMNNNPKYTRILSIGQYNDLSDEEKKSCEPLKEYGPNDVIVFGYKQTLKEEPIEETLSVEEAAFRKYPVCIENISKDLNLNNRESFIAGHTHTINSKGLVELDKVVEVINNLIYKDADNDLKIGFNQGITTIRENLLNQLKTINKI